MISVICELCLHHYNEKCPICSGTRRYQWDPQTFLCFSSSGIPLKTYSENGEVLPVIRHLPLTEMISAIERWIKEDRDVRKWRLGFQDDRWSSCLWLNRYSKVCRDSDSDRIEVCIAETYQEILKMQMEST